MSQSNPDKKISEQRESSFGASLGYPKLDFPESYYLHMIWYKYQRPDPKKEGGLIESGTVKLPLPENLIESHSMTYKDEDMGGVAAFLDASRDDGGRTITQNIIDAAKKNSVQALNDEIMAQIPNALSGAGGAFKYMAAKTLQETAIGGYITQELGMVPNPHPSVVFQGVQMRSHEFTWRFSPKSADDSSALKSVLLFLKQKSLPPVQGIFLGYPDMADLIIAGPSMDFKLKRCHLERMSVNYTPEGGPNFFVDKHPFAINLSCTFKEMEYFTRDDFEKEYKK